MMWPGVDGSPLPSPVVVSPGGSAGDWSGTPVPSASGSGSLPGCLDDQPVSGASCADSSPSPVPTATSTVTIEPSASPAAFDSDDVAQWSASMQVVAAGIILLVLFAAIRTVAGFRRDR